MTRRIALLVLACVLSAPCEVKASVMLSEVAWMGSVEDPNAEWIELYNDGPDQNMKGWTVSAADGKPSITLTGTLRARAYAVLERTGDDTLPGAAFLIYAGGLANTGEVLELHDAHGTVVDRVDGSDGWAIGGSNETKETLQRSGIPPTGVWMTGALSPRTGILPAPVTITPPVHVPSAAPVQQKPESVSKPATVRPMQQETASRVPDSTSTAVSVKNSDRNVAEQGTPTVAAVAFADTHTPNTSEDLWWYLIGLMACIGCTLSIAYLARTTPRDEKEYIAGYEIDSIE